MKHWEDHPAVRTGEQLTLGERAADVMRNRMGSWPFLWTFLFLMAVWAVVNTLLLQRIAHHRAFDPYPYILLNLMLSTLAGLQGVILLIASKRQDQIAGELAKHDYEVNQTSLEILKELRAHTKGTS